MVPLNVILLKLTALTLQHEAVKHLEIVTVFGTVLHMSSSISGISF